MIRLKTIQKKPPEGKIQGLGRSLQRINDYRGRYVKSKSGIITWEEAND